MVLPLGFARGGVNQVEVGFAVGMIQADDQVEFIMFVFA